MTELSRIHHENYELLVQLFGGHLERLPEAVKSEVPGYMNLNFDRLCERAGQVDVALSHYWKHPSGDMIADPDMVLRIDYAKQSVEALSYQDQFGYREVYEDLSNVGAAGRNEREFRGQNEFLRTWLHNCIEQGHSLRVAEPTTGAA